MIIDAMDILYTGNVDGFCIVSSDSDFTRLASRLREAGMWVVGMGERKTPPAFIAACNKFKYLEVLAQSVQPDLVNGPDQDCLLYTSGEYGRCKVEKTNGNSTIIRRFDMCGWNGQTG